MTTQPVKSTTRSGLISAIAFVGVALGVGALGGLATASSVTTWYLGLNKPAFNPPNAVFGPVWTILYILMAVAAWRVWRRARRSGLWSALTLYAAQLVLNLAWSLIFFGLRQPAWALGEVVVLLSGVVMTAVVFWRIDRLSGLMMIPYAVWVAFAAVLNLEIWRLN
ncbi:TspO/MBR family protein [Phenylobacterium sp.]|uniref:TspO/MBR family protein n=1 Tax=Phenylobacterium sp. TaxID=1871053 RepID=UPI001205246A|nr:TspO/MBR family protein [Phenylobacterium sp.]THD59293.1 MAG: tryptophan-rich sensory protein [Phenylobacterium sp.]